MVLTDLLYPRRCAVCDTVIATEENGICEDCRTGIKYMSDPRCLKCSKPLLEEEEEYCGDCAKAEHVFRQGVALFAYEYIRKSLYRFKYQGRYEYGEFYGREIGKHLGDVIKDWGVEALIPIPLYPAKERRRGYNQAAVLAEGISRYTGIPVRAELLKRVRSTKPMKELNAAERQINLKNAFHIASDDVKLKAVAVVDDIYTTGTTLDEAARVLYRHGVESVYFVTLSIGVI